MLSILLKISPWERRTTLGEKKPHLDRTLIPLAVKPHQSVCSLHLEFKPTFLLPGFEKVFLSPDHPIHPPQMEGDPWDCEVLPDCGYSFKIKKVRFQFCLSLNISARVSSTYTPTMKTRNRTSRFLLRWFFLFPKYRQTDKDGLVPGA